MDKQRHISSIWEFDPSDDSSYLTHGLYRWYGKLVPQLVAKVLDQYAKKGDNVIANFNGSGTIALEAMIRGINCTGTDISPLALLISKVKTTKLIIDDIDNEIKEIIDKAKDVEDKVKVNHLYQPEKWFNGRNAYKLTAIKTVIDDISNEDKRNFYFIALANIVRDCSNVDSRCVNHIIVDKNRTTKDVYIAFRSSAVEMYESVCKLYEYDSESKIEFMKQSADDMSYAQDESIDLVFSHPPYLNAVNYYNINRLSTDMLGMNYDEIRSEDFSAKKLDLFLNFMDATFKESYRVLRNGKRCVVVIGDTRFKGNIITLGVDFVNLLKKNGFVIEDIFIWKLNRKAGMNVARRGNFIDHNYIIVAKKEIA